MLARVYSYMRFSTPEQAKGHSLQRQTDYATQYAQDNGLVLDESLTMRDEGLSAYHQKHISKGALGAFYRAVEEGLVEPGSILIVENLDRLSRAKPLDALPRFLDIIRAGITVVIAKDGRMYSKESIDSNPFQLFESLIEMVRANKESEHKSERVKGSIINKIKHWQNHGYGKIVRIGRDPFWLKENADKTGFEFINGKIEIIRLIVEKYISGWGAVKIINYCQEHYNMFPNGSHYMSHIINILRNRSLIGERAFVVGGEKYIIKGYYPKAISIDSFDLLQHCIKNRATTKAQQRKPSIVTGIGISFCGHCCRSLVTKNHKIRPTKKNKGTITNGLRRLICDSRISNPRCPSLDYTGKSLTQSISIVPIERALLEYCSDQMELSAILNDDTDKSLAIKAQMCELQRQAGEAETVVNNGNEAMTRLLIQGDDVTAINNLVKEHQTKLDELQTKIQKLEDELRFQKVHKSSDMIDQWQQVKKDIYNLDEEARLLIRQIVKKTFKRMDIYFHSFGKSKAGRKLKLDIPDDLIVMKLTFINDKTRILAIDRKSGHWVKKGDLSVSEAECHQDLVAGPSSDHVAPA